MDFESFLMIFIADVFMYLMIISLLSYTLKKNAFQYKSRYYISVIYLIIFCMFPVYDTDYFHYMQIIKNLTMGGKTNLEDFYINLVNLVDGSYTLFRLIVWGTAICLSIWLSKISNINKSLFLFILVGVFITKFAYTRAFLAMITGIVSVPLLFKKDSDFKHILLGIILLLLSLNFHKSAAFTLPMILISFLCLKMNKRNIKIYFLLYPIAFLLMNALLKYIVNFDSSESELAVNSAQYYLQSTGSYGFGISTMISYLTNRSVYYLIVILYICLVYKGYFAQFPRHIKMFANLSFFIITISTLFYFITSLNANAFYYRFLYFSMVPNAVLLTYCISNRIYYKFSKFIVLFGILGVLYTFMYNFYASFFVHFDINNI